MSKLIQVFFQDILFKKQELGLVWNQILPVAEVLEFPWGFLDN